MHAPGNRKNKITLTDYNYKRDINTRLLMSKLSVEAVVVLREVLDSSLKTTFSSLAESLEISRNHLISILEQLKPTGLFHSHGEQVFVDKETRKYLEFEILKFDPDYEMGMEFLQNLLSKVPIHATPTWYPLSKNAENLFSSIIEKYMLTPQLYQRYLDELIVDYPHAKEISHELMTTPDGFLKATDVMKKHGISHEEFEECILHLEYNFVCCLTFRETNGYYEEIIIPFFEWSEYLSFERSTRPKPLEPSEEIKRDFEDDFGFLKDLANYLKKVKPESEKVLAKTKMLQFVEETPDGFLPTERAEHWLRLPIQEQAAALYRYMLRPPFLFNGFSDKDVRQVQNALKQVTKSGWIYFEDFLNGFTSSIGDAEGIILKNKGKRWRYARPVFSEKEKAFIYNTIFETFLDIGIVATGRHQNKPCFCVTPFGRFSLEN